MNSDKWIEAYNDISELERNYLEWFEEVLEEVHDEAVKNALKFLEKLSKIRYLKSDLYTDGVNLQQDIVIEPILEKIAEEREFLEKMK